MSNPKSEATSTRKFSTVKTLSLKVIGAESSPEDNTPISYNELGSAFEQHHQIFWTAVNQIAAATLSALKGELPSEAEKKGVELGIERDDQRRLLRSFMYILANYINAGQCMPIITKAARATRDYKRKDGSSNKSPGELYKKIGKAVNSGKKVSLEDDNGGHAVRDDSASENSFEIRAYEEFLLCFEYFAQGWYPLNHFEQIVAEYHYTIKAEIISQGLQHAFSYYRLHEEWKKAKKRYKNKVKEWLTDNEALLTRAKEIISHLESNDPEFTPRFAVLPPAMTFLQSKRIETDGIDVSVSRKKRKRAFVFVKIAEQDPQLADELERSGIRFLGYIARKKVGEDGFSLPPTYTKVSTKHPRWYVASGPQSGKEWSNLNLPKRRRNHRKLKTKNQGSKPQHRMQSRGYVDLYLMRNGDTGIERYKVTVPFLCDTRLRDRCQLVSAPETVQANQSYTFRYQEHAGKGFEVNANATIGGMRISLSRGHWHLSPVLKMEVATEALSPATKAKPHTKSWLRSIGKENDSKWKEKKRSQLLPNSVVLCVLPRFGLEEPFSYAAFCFSGEKLETLWGERLFNLQTASAQNNPVAPTIDSISELKTRISEHRQTTCHIANGGHLPRGQRFAIADNTRASNMVDQRAVRMARGCIDLAQSAHREAIERELVEAGVKPLVITPYLKGVSTSRGHAPETNVAISLSARGRFYEYIDQLAVYHNVQVASKGLAAPQHTCAECGKLGVSKERFCCEDGHQSSVAFNTMRSLVLSYTNESMFTEYLKFLNLSSADRKKRLKNIQASQ